MALKPYIKDNYIWIEDSVANLVYEGLAKDVRFNRKFVTAPEGVAQQYGVTGINGYDGVFTYADLDGSVAGFSNEATFETWYTENTGKSNGGGTSGKTFTGEFDLSNENGSSYLPYTQTDDLTLSTSASTIVGSVSTVRFTANGSAITGYAGWKLLSSDGITATNGVVHRVIVYQYEDEIWYSVKLN